MARRLYHVPALHVSRHGHERKVGWLELFYDLIYVAAIIQLGSSLSDHVSLGGFLAYAAVFVPIWFTWTGYTFYQNRFVLDDAPHRGLVFLQMLAIGGVAISLPRLFAGETQGFAFAYTLARLAMVGMYGRAYVQLPETRPMTGRYTRGFALGAALWLASAWVPAPWTYAVWAVALLVDLYTPLGRSAQALLVRYPPDMHHISERFGLLILIVLGESFVKVLTALADQGATPATAAMAAMGLGVTASLWWIYFDDVAGARIRTHRPLGVIAWVYGHLPLAISVTAVGVALKKAALAGPMELGSPKYRIFLCGVLALTFLSVALIDEVTERRQSQLSDRTRVLARVASAGVVLVIALIGGLLPTWGFLTLVVLLCAGQIVFDLFMVPEQDEPAAHPAPSEPAPPAPRPATPSQASPRRWDPTEAVRLGTPNELRRDLYFLFLEGSWSRVLLGLGFVYLFGNVIFAALYLLDPTGVNNAAPGSFLDAFFFSVQTMATIGYGVLSPASTWANALVTIEAGLALVGVAVVSGLVFARISRPKASVLFSENIVVSRYQGKPTLMFRVGNARGNDLVEASIRVSVLRDETSDGHTMRRLVDLPLVRDTQPLFAMSWTVMHIIDETSPFYGVDPTQVSQSVVMMVATLTGHDGTYNSTIYARKVWWPEVIYYNHRFVDVISRLPDGRMQVNYEPFHRVVPESP